MKITSAIYVITAIAALSLSSQAFARGGGMGGSGSHGSLSGTSRMASTMTQAGSSMQQGAMLGNMSQQGTAIGSGSKMIMPTGAGAGAGQQHGQVNGNGAGPTTMQPPVTAKTN